MGVLDEVVKRAANLPLQSMDVPEFGGITVYWKPITLRERSDFFGDGNFNLERFAVIVCKKGLTADGKSMFDAEDRLKMLRTPGLDDAVIRLATAMCKTASFEDVEKN